MPYVVFLLIWGIFSVSQIGYDLQDEHFQSLEIVSKLLFGYGTLTWEWTQGLRSWLIPEAMSKVVQIAMTLGIHDRLWLDAFVRLAQSIWWLPSIWAIGSIYESLFGPCAIKKKHAQYFLALAWPLVIWGTRHGLDPLGVPPFLIGLAFYLKQGAPRKKAYPQILTTGCFFALALTIRYTLIIPLVFSFLGIFFLKNGFKKNFIPNTNSTTETRNDVFKKILWIPILTGFVFLVLQWVDANTYFKTTGHYRFPAWEFFKFNILQGSGSFSKDPWYYFLMVLPVVWVPGLGFFFFRIRNLFEHSAPSTQQSQSLAGVRYTSWVLLGSLMMFSLIPHKEYRFLFPLLPFTVLLSIPFLKNTKFLYAIQITILFFAWCFYSKPHGNLVQGLAKISHLSQKTSIQKIVFVEHGHFFIPQFYLNKPFSFQTLSSKAWKKICSYKKNKHLKVTSLKTILALSPQKCPLPTHACTLQTKIPVSYGHKLRDYLQKKQRKYLKFIYACNIPTHTLPTL